MALSKYGFKFSLIALILLGAKGALAQQNVDTADPVSTTPMLIITITVILLVAAFIVLASWLSRDGGHSETTNPAKDFGAEGQAAAGVAAFEKARVVAELAEKMKAKGVDDHEEINPADSSNRP